MAEPEGRYRPDVAVPPGATLRENLELLGITQAELARRANRPSKTINEIVQGKVAITADTAIQFERVLGIPARFWNNLQRNYEETKARLDAEKKLATQVAQLSPYPYAEMARRSWVRATRSKIERVQELLAFFGVASLSRVPTVQQAAFRRSGSIKRTSPEALAAWLRKGEKEARNMDLRPYDGAAFRDVLVEARGLVCKPVREWQHALRSLCASCGVAVVFVPHLPKTYAHGATKWLTPNKAIVQLSIRYSYEDIFWFTFFHEAGHILKHGKSRQFVDQDGMRRTAEEIEADAFAANLLIPRQEYLAFADRPRFSLAGVVSFANEVDISAGIVVGRLQHDKRIPQSHLNRLRRKLKWANST